MNDELTSEQVEKLLWEAESAHAEFEKRLGQRDSNWARWYADFIVKKLNESG